MFFHPAVIRGVASFARDIFPILRYYYTLVPTYPSGSIGFYFCGLTRDPLKDLSEERATRLKGLKYYTPEVHRAAFSLPRFSADLIRPE
jgi:spermidine synthase